MLERSVPVYKGNNFEVCDRYLSHEFKDYWEKGAIVERKMPCPTRKNPEKTKTVYYWIGENSAKIRDLSSQMPASVTVRNAEGSYIHQMIVRAWRPIVAFT